MFEFFPVRATIVHSLEKATLNVLEWLYASQKLPQQPVTKFRLPKTERNNQIIERYAQGDTLEELSRDFGISTARVHQIIQRWGKQ